MKVQDLIDALQEMPLDMDVEFAYDYGDHWHNIVSKPIKIIEVMPVIYSDYHRSNKLADENEDGETRDVVILN